MQTMYQQREEGTCSSYAVQTREGLCCENS